MSQNDKPQADESVASDSLWAIVLAAGAGTRLARLTRLLYGTEIPKQFAALDGDATLLQRTMDRLRPVVPSTRTVVVVAQGFEDVAHAQLHGYPGVTVVVQPKNAGTGNGLLLPLTYVRAVAPQATVIVTPADHHIAQPGCLPEVLRLSADAALSAPSGIALVGAEPDADEDDLGWIVGASAVPAPVDSVARFIEKPPREVAAALRAQGALWNTLICAGRVDAFWSLCERHLPRQTRRFCDLATQGGPGSLRARTPAPMVQEIYQTIEKADLSRDVLERASGLAVVRLPARAGWSDWGTPERLLACIKGTVAFDGLVRRIQRNVASQEAAWQAVLSS